MSAMGTRPAVSTNLQYSHISITSTCSSLYCSGGRSTDYTHTHTHAHTLLQLNCGLLSTVLTCKLEESEQ